MPLEERKTSLGSGVIVGATAHRDQQPRDRARNQIAITTADHRRFRVLVGTDPVTDIAVVKIEARALATLPGVIPRGGRRTCGRHRQPAPVNQTPVTMGIISATGC
jgi:S1-C subfamily serine protease